MLRGDPSLTQTDTTHHIRARFLTRSFARIRATHTTSNAAHKGNPDEAEPSRGVTRAKKVHTSVTDTAGSPEPDLREMELEALQRVCQPVACSTSTTVSASVSDG
jgi:hypothetical protein